MTDEPEKNHQILTQPPETIYPASDEFDRSIEEQLTSAVAETPTEIPTRENDFTPTPAENTPETTPVESELTAIQSPATTIQETGIIVVETSPEIPPADMRKFLPESATETDRLAANQNVNPASQPAKIWQLLLVFFSGMLVGSVISLGTLLAWRMYQERANIQIKLPADVPLPPSPSPAATTPARQQPGIPAAPIAASPLPTNNPSPNPTQIPSLSGVPQLAATPLPSPPAAGFPPSPSPSPAAETAVTDRINFEAGATGTTLSNTLPDNKSKRYLIDCKGGQTMTLNVPEGTVSATIIAPNGETVGTANSTTPWEGQLPASGDYTIEISGESQANYGVKIEVK
ncbi:MAG: hypothetical protein HC786_14600 [Richelia sp. CSU_2_1]|nr:hypothetical protein [Richelia sp. CSU_2_1]